MNTNIKRIAIYDVSDPDGCFDDYRKFFLSELKKYVDHIFIIVRGQIDPSSINELEKYSDDYKIEKDTLFLADSWKEAIKSIGWKNLYQYDELLLIADNFYGPVFSLEELFNTAEKINSGLFGVAAEFEYQDFSDLYKNKPINDKNRDVIPYFYIVKNDLLHSKEFVKYWNGNGKCKNERESLNFTGKTFFQYIRKSGFPVVTFEDNSLEKYCDYNFRYNNLKLLSEQKIPFILTAISEDVFQLNKTTRGYGKDPRKTLDYLQKKTDYDINMIWDHLLRTKDINSIWKHFQLEYVLSEKITEKPFTYTKPIAVIVHIYYTDLVELIAQYCENFPRNTVFYITTINDETLDQIKESFSGRNLQFTVKKRPNVGVAMSTLWITYADVVLNGEYDYIFYFHDKKSKYFKYTNQGEQFAKRCYENLCGTRALIENIINLFENNERLGVLGSAKQYNGQFLFSDINSWKQYNFNNTKNLAEVLDLDVSISEDHPPVAAHGDMLWFRAKALAKAIGHGFTYEDFNIKYDQNGTLFHAIEHIYAVAAQDSGYYYADVRNIDYARADLVNYKVMLNRLFVTLVNNGLYESGLFDDEFPSVINFIERFNNNDIDDYFNDLSSVPFKKMIREKLKIKLPRVFYERIVKTKRFLFGPHNIPFSYDE